jgi:undecaprenyl-diphosphatase
MAQGNASSAGALQAAMTKTGISETADATTVTVTRDGYRISPRHALAAAAACWLAFAVTVALVETGHTATLDHAGLTFWRHRPDLVPRGPAWLLEGVRDWTALGGVLVRNLFGLGALTALLFLRLRREAALLGLTLMSGWVVDTAIKSTVGRPRPTLVPHLTEAAGASFPSGHSFNSACVYIAIALAFAALSPRRSVRWTLIGAAVVMTILIALSRVWLGVHWPSDAIAGWSGGAAWAFTASALLYRPAKALAPALPQAEAQLVSR